MNGKIARGLRKIARTAVEHKPIKKSLLKKSKTLQEIEADVRNTYQGLKKGYVIERKILNNK